VRFRQSHLLSLSQFVLAVRNSIHVDPNDPSRIILHRVVQIARSSFRSNQLHADHRRFALILSASTASGLNPVDQI